MLVFCNITHTRALRYLSYKFRKFAMEETKGDLKPKVSQEKMMKAVILTGTKEFQVKEVPIPKPGPGELLVKILAAPINPSDLAFIGGGYQSVKKLPTTPGFEGAGVVIESGGGLIAWSMVGKNVAVSISKGDSGTYGQYAIVDATTCMTLPNEISIEQGSMSFVNPLTALAMLDKTKSGKHQAIIHTAAASSLGRMLNRLFITEGIPIINVVRREQQVEILKKEGAKFILNSETPTFEEDLKKMAAELKADYCFEAIGGQFTGKILKNMPKHSIIEVYGVLSLNPHLSHIQAGDTLFNHKTIKGFLLPQWLQTKNILGKLALMRRLQNLLKGELKSQIAEQFSLDQFREGVEHYMKNMTKGKVLIKPWKT